MSRIKRFLTFLWNYPPEHTEPEQEQKPPALLYPIASTADGEIELDPKIRDRHCYVIGATGAGKTTLIKTLIARDIEAGRGVALIDPHGDAADELLGIIPDEREDDVIYFDASSPLSPAFNPLQLNYDRPKLVDDFLSAFTMLYEDSWGDRLDHLFRMTLHTLLADTEPHSLADLKRLLIDPNYQQELRSRIQDSELQLFWDHDFPTNTKHSIPAAMNKLSAVLSPASHLQRIFSEPTNDIDFRSVMDGRKIFLCKLAKGIIGESSAKLLGALIACAIQQAALSRADVSESKRIPFFFYVDEFQNYVVRSFNTILEEARKYQLCLTMAHQNLSQLPSSLQKSAFGSATMIAFRLSAEDAPKLQKEMRSSRVVARLKTTTDTTPLPSLLSKITTQIRHDLALIEKRWNEPGLSGYTGKRSKIAIDIRQWGDQYTYLQRKLRQLESGNLNAQSLKEIFREIQDNMSKVWHINHYDFLTSYEIRDWEWPSADDFTNLDTHQFFMRVERPENVTQAQTIFPPSPRSNVKQSILERQKRAHELKPKKTEPEPKPEDTAVDDEDFWN